MRATPVTKERLRKFLESLAVGGYVSPLCFEEMYQFSVEYFDLDVEKKPDYVKPSGMVASGHGKRRGNGYLGDVNGAGCDPRYGRSPV